MTDFATLLAHHRALHAAGRDESRCLEPGHTLGPRYDGSPTDWGFNVGQLSAAERASWNLGYSEDARLARRPTRRAR